MARHFDPDAMHMTIGEHLDELRVRLTASLVGVGVIACVMLYFGKSVILILCVPLTQTQIMFGLLPNTVTHAVPTGFTIYLKVSLIGGLIIGSPWVVYQIWRFVAAGLYKHEQRAVLIVIPFSAIMTLIGILFMYFVMLPVCLWFFFAFATSYPDVATSNSSPLQWLLKDAVGTRRQSTPPDQDDGQATATSPAPLVIPILPQDPDPPQNGQIWIKAPQMVVRVHANGHTMSMVPATTTLMSPLIEIGQYINFVTILSIGIAVAFQLPVVMLLLGWTGIMSAAMIVPYRRYCVFGCFAVGALLTPSDVLSMFLLAVPLWGLFELGLVLMRVTAKRKEA